MLAYNFLILFYYILMMSVCFSAPDQQASYTACLGMPSITISHALSGCPCCCIIIAHIAPSLLILCSLLKLYVKTETEAQVTN